MNDFLELLLFTYAACLPISLVAFGIHFWQKRSEKKGKELPEKEVKEVSISKLLGWFVLFLPPLLVAFLWVYEKLGGIFGIIVIIGLPGALLSFLRKVK